MQQTIVEFCGQPIDINAYLLQTVNFEHGAQDIFIGKVRDFNQNREVVGIEYEVFTPLASITLEQACVRARMEICPNLDIIIVHRFGYLCVGEISVLICVGSKHRDEAFVACRYLIEEIKHQVPIWKQEHYIDGKSEWVKGHALCQA
ncbi:MAG: molybdopterin synthase catalytic subunit [Pseudomonadota bacterium]|nr:molybdopterin synthase catalytic subunit [Pseudomonadota bacterium]